MVNSRVAVSFAQQRSNSPVLVPTRPGHRNQSPPMKVEVPSVGRYSESNKGYSFFRSPCGPSLVRDPNPASKRPPAEV